MKNFKELKVWQKGFKIALEAYKLTSEFPPNERFGLVSQINRASVSISSNVAEGSSRISAKDYNHFIQIALGSCFELETQLLIAKELRYGNQVSIAAILALLTEEEKMLTAFGNALMRKPAAV